MDCSSARKPETMGDCLWLNDVKVKWVERDRRQREMDRRREERSSKQPREREREAITKQQPKQGN